ncbi:MAG: single-stranded DNA-binding protein [Labilibaculum sp.]|nr:single-stranded DNA-binding protein [Labilibaculum sp.]MBI9060274.1 single-stranded DNA-binding protein [Labilibaculum sp.]
MAFSLNQASLIGNLGNDAETKDFKEHKKTTFSLATTHSYKDKNGEWQNKTTWHNIAGWNLSDFYLSKLVKGAKVHVTGRIDNREYQDSNGNKKYFSEIILGEIIPLDRGEVSENKTGFQKSAEINDENLPKWVTEDLDNLF